MQIDIGTKIRIDSFYDFGHFYKDDLTYEIRDLARTWKLVAFLDNAKFEVSFLKRRIPTLDDLIHAALDIGFTTDMKVVSPDKTMYYNPIEIAERIRVTLDGKINEYIAGESDWNMYYINQLFLLSRSKLVDKIEIYLTSHEEAYYRFDCSKPDDIPLQGWVDLADYKDGGGYADDPFGC